ncbi:MAG: hypothetical protein ACRDT4_05580 [Micromonosporaceae bacterium]
MQTWEPARHGEWIAWCAAHIHRGGKITDYIAAPYATWGLLIARTHHTAGERVIPKRTIRYHGGDPATCPLYMPGGTIWLPDGPIDPATEQTPPVPAFDDLEFCALPGYLDLVPRR